MHTDWIENNQVFTSLLDCKIGGIIVSTERVDVDHGVSTPKWSADANRRTTRLE